MRKKALTDQQWAAISLLAEGMSQTKVAEIIGVVRKTIYNWLQDPDFQQALNQAIIDIERAERAGRIQKARKVAGAALDELMRRLEDPEQLRIISVKELKDIYKDIISTINVELKQDFVTQDLPRDEDSAPEVEKLHIDETMLEKDSFRKGLLDLIKKHVE